MTIKYSDVASLPNGAQFYSADLHIHSFGASPDVRDTGMTVEAIIKQAAADGLSIIAITDHNSVRNSQAAIDYAREHYPGSLLVLAGIEVTTAHGHLLVYFSPDATDRLLSFYGRLNIVNPGTKESHTTMSMADVATEAQRLGGLCVAAHIDRKSGFEASAAGYPNWKKDIVSHPAIVGVEVDDVAHLAWYSGDDDSSHEGAERKRLLAARSAGAAGRSVLAHVQNSDAHDINGFEASHKKKTRTRMKMDALTFEGFRTAMSDPEARVRAVSALPPGYPRVLAVHVRGGFLDAESYRYSDNLTCFIGGRGTGKSTTLKCLAFAMGASDSLADYDNCPDSVVVWCRDAQGITYRYERMRGADEPTVKAWEAGKTLDASVDSFRVEYYGQGDLARVAADPLARPDLLQEFLDRHTNLHDLAAQESDLVAKLDQNGSSLRPLEVGEAGRKAKSDEVAECDKKLRIAEEGHLKDIAAQQSAIGAEKALAKSLSAVATSHASGLSLQDFVVDYDAITSTVGTLTGDARIAGHLASVKRVIDAANDAIRKAETAINHALAASAGAIRVDVAGIGQVHMEMEAQLAPKIADLQSAGLSASLADLNKVVARRGALVGELGKLDAKRPELTRLRTERAQLIRDLAGVRQQRDQGRRVHIRAVNNHLARAIEDYTIAVVYDPAGLRDQFVRFLLEHMQGTYLQEEQAWAVCAATTPQALSTLIESGDVQGVANLAGIGPTWAKRIIERLGRLATRHRLEVLDKPAAPTIRVITKTGKKQIPVSQLSDGQKHTILLTIAMLAESEVPLIIDQPEDDLDNAFVFSSVVRMLRDVKERRQVLLVTHNANIAVLGDAELIYPMRRTGDQGRSFDAGSIDRAETKEAVQSILEGGQRAFLRRKEIYGH